MKALKIVIASLSLSALVLAAGCGKNKAVKATEDMADAVCKCKDMACATEAVNKGTAELMKYKDEKGTESDAKAIQAASEKMAKCMAKLTQ